MPLISGEITREGAVIPVLVGVSRNRQKVLERNRLPVPEKIPVLAQIDTGSDISAFMPEVFEALDIRRIDEVPVRTPSTDPEELYKADLHDVSITLVSGTTQYYLPSLQVIVTKDFEDNPDSAKALLGRDVLDRCVFEYAGPHKRFTLSF
jgi:hypothetical protein